MILKRVQVRELLPPLNPIRASIDEDELAELTEDVKQNGVRIPLHVRTEGKRFRVVAGHRRLLAARSADVDDVPVLVLSAADGASELLMLTENLFRQELTAVEEGALFAQLMEANENDIDKVCARVGKSRNYVDTRLALLSGDPLVLTALAERKISMSVATELNRIAVDKWRHYYLGWCIQNGAKLELVKFWRQTANAQLSDIEQPERPPTPPPDGPPTAAEVWTCAVCGQAERTHEMGVAMIHHDCRAALITAIDNAAANALDLPPEPTQ